MRIHELKIRNFRGIRELGWRPRPGVTCLVGAGDSTKTTIIDAISLCLSHRWNVDVGDSDFWLGDPDNENLIEATLVNLSRNLVDVEVFGYSLRGIGEDGSVIEDPAGDEAAVTIRFSVGRSLEPLWHVIASEAADEHQRMSANQRQHLGVIRIDEGGAEHLRWARGSALLRMTGDTEELPLILAEAQRSARTAIFDDQEPTLLSAAVAATELAYSEQVPALDEPRAGLDPLLQLRSGMLQLHAGELPAESLGLGSRRLLSIAIQRAAAALDQNILLIDEVEYGLEPHRLRGLLYRLREAAQTGTQVFLSTHSPVALENLDIDQVAFVRRSEGRTRVSQVPEEVADLVESYQKIARSAPSALLSDRVIVGEGATEKGICWAIVERLASPTAATARSVSVMNGVGTGPALLKAGQLAAIGYEVLAFVDGDGALKEEDVSEAKRQGAAIFHWNSVYFEAQLFADMPADLLDVYVQLAVDGNGSSADARQSLIDQVSSRLGSDLLGDTPSVWLQNGAAEADLRGALGKAAHEKGWFKQETMGYRLGSQLCEDWQQIKGTSLHKGLKTVRDFARSI